MTRAKPGAAFTLIELMVVVIIIGILATIAVPSYWKAVESTKGREAETTLMMIKDAELRYRIGTGGSQSYGSKAQLDTSGELPSAYLSSTSWAYDIVVDPLGCGGIPSNPCTGFDAVANRSDGVYKDKKRHLYVGTATPSGTPKGVVVGSWPPP